MNNLFKVKSTFLRLTTFLLLLHLSLYISAQKKDFAIWYTAGARYEVTKKIKIDLSEELRTNSNAGETDQFFTDVGVSYKFNKYISIGGYYRFIRKREDDENFHTRNRFYGELELSVPIKRFELQYRFRFQRQVNQYSEYVINDPILHNRHRLKIDYNVPKIKLTPSVFYERYFRLNYVSSYFANNERFGTSLSYNFNKKHKAEVAYLIENDLYPKEKRTYILSLGYRFTFK